MRIFHSTDTKENMILNLENLKTAFETNEFDYLLKPNSKAIGKEPKKPKKPERITILN